MTTNTQGAFGRRARELIALNRKEEEVGLDNDSEKDFPEMNRCFVLAKRIGDCQPEILALYEAAQKMEEVWPDSPLTEAVAALDRKAAR